MEDVIIKLRISGDKVVDFCEGFLAVNPVPQIKGELPDTLVNKYTDKEWFTMFLVDAAKAEYNRGKTKLALDGVVRNHEIIESID